MMRRWVMLAVALVPVLAMAQGAQRPVRADPERLVWSMSLNGVMSNTFALGGYVLPSGRGFTIETVIPVVYVLSGGGAGNTVVTITDGTNTCTVTMACASTGTTLGGRRLTAAAGAGTGCSFAGGASLTASVTTAGCSTPQPAIRNIDFVGRWH